MLLILSLLIAGCRLKRAEIPSGAQPRVVSLAPNLTEVICAIGAEDLLVGRTRVCDYPPSVAKIAAIGDFGNPSLERLVAARPTLILDVALADEATGHKIRNLGLRRERVPCSKLDDIPEALEQVGRLLQRETAATNLATAMKARIRELRDQARTIAQRPTVYVEIWWDPSMTVGRGSFLSELVYLAGGKNAGDESPQEYFRVSSEWVVARNPDVVLCLYMSKDGSARQRVLSRQGWESLTAVKSGRVYDGFDNNMMLRPGPRILQSVEALRQSIAGGVKPQP